MCRAFFDESGFAAETSFDAESMCRTLMQLMGNEDAALFVADGGLAAALAYPHYFNAREKTAQELFWWVRPEKRGGPIGVRLLRALEQWARSRGCKTLSMICLPALSESPAERMYQRLGYRASERSYIKRL